MNRTTVLTTTVLSCALLTPAVPASASAVSAASVPTGAQVAQGHDHDRWEQHKRDHKRDRHRHWRGFAIAGVIEDIDLNRGEIRIDPRRGRDRVIEVRDFTRIRLDGDRANLADLDSGDRVLVRGVKKHGDRYALRIWADER